MTSTDLFAEAVDPYAWHGTPGLLYGAYGWGPGMNIGMPFNYTQHIGYERVPVAGTWSGSAQAQHQEI